MCVCDGVCVCVMVCVCVCDGVCVMVCVTGDITSIPLIVTQFILVQPATHKGNSLKTLFTKYMTHDMTTTQVHITHEAWHDI